MHALIIIMSLMLAAPAAPADTQTPNYVLHDTNVSCSCRQDLASKMVHCYLVEAVNSSSFELECKQLPFMIISRLTIDCSNFTFKSEVDLHEMTFLHSRGNDRIFPPYNVELIHCRVKYENLSFGQLQRENVSTHESVMLANLGPLHSRLAALYTERLEYDSTFEPGHCKLISVVLRNCIVVYFPLYLNMKCQGLVEMQLIDTPLDVISVSNMMGVMSLQNFVVSRANLSMAGENIYDLAMDSLNHYLDDAVENRSATLRNKTAWLVKLKKQLGQLTWQKVLFKASDDSSSTSGFTFSFAQHRIREGPLFERLQKWELIPSQLSHFDLSYNQLTKIPNVISLLSNLIKLNLSHNAISSLYDNNMCWSPSDVQTCCYWFRAPKDSLRILDLSYNQIPFIGAVSPWFEVKLQYLDLSHNYLKSINAMAFSQSVLTTSLLELSLNYNWLQKFELASLTRLEKLEISNNDLKMILTSSIPQSPNLTLIRLNHNFISDIDCDCFTNLTQLHSLELRNNSITDWHSDYFKMSNRSNRASRVLLFISDQKVEQQCPCSHVYAISEHEVQKQGKDCTQVYQYPQFATTETKKYSCEFFDRENATQKSLKTLEQSHPSDFICPYYDEMEVEIYPQYFPKNWTGPHRIKCIRSCLCWHSFDWIYSDVNCDYLRADPFNVPIRIPVKKLWLNNAEMIGIAGKFTRNTISWANAQVSPSNGLRYLSLSNSNILHIEDYAFNGTDFSYNIEMLYLSKNKLRVISQFTFTGLEDKLCRLELHDNLIRPFDLGIFNNFRRLSILTLRGNAWVCSCETGWLRFQTQLMNISQLGQFVNDFEQIECKFLDKIFNEAYNEYIDSGWTENYRLNLSAPYQVNDRGRLQRLCVAIETYQDARRQAVLKWTLTAVGAAFGCLLLVALVTKRHKVYGAVEMFFILKYMQNSRRQRSGRAAGTGDLCSSGGGHSDAFEFDVFFLADQQDELTLVSVLRDLDSAFRFYRLSSSQAIDYAVHRSSGLLQQTRFESVSDGVRFSRTVVVLLSRRFLHAGFHDLLQAVDEMSASGRNPSDHIVLLKLARDLSNERPQQSYGHQVSGAVAALFSRSVQHGTIDWEYKVASLVCRAKFQQQHQVTGVPMRTRASVELSGEEDVEILAGAGGMPTDSGSLMDDVCTLDMAAPTLQQQPEWPPHSGGCGCDVLLLAQPPTPEEASAARLLRSIVAESASRRLLLASCQPSLVVAFPDSFERVFNGAAEATPRFLKRTRQFVILLTPAMVRWFQEEAEENRQLLADLLELMQATKVTRRFLVFLDDRVSAETTEIYKRMAERNLPANATPRNTFRLAEAAEKESERHWKRSLYRRTAD